MAESDSPDPTQDEGEGTTDKKHRHHRQQKNTLKLSAGQLSVEAESSEESVSELSDTCSAEMERLMRYHIRGELEVIEEEDLHSIFLGGGGD